MKNPRIKKRPPEENEAVQIEQQLDALIEQQKRHDRWRHHLVWSVLALMFLITALSFSGELVQRTLRLFRSPLENMRLEQSARIKADVVRSSTGEVTLSHLRTWINHYNRDFYGPSLSEEDETFLLAWGTWESSGKKDVFHLDRPFAGKPGLTWREWLSVKTRLKKIYGGYYNPVFANIDKKLKKLRFKQQALYARPLPRFLADSLAAHVRTAGVSSLDLRKLFTDFVQKNNYVLENETRLAREMEELRYERDIRLGLLAVRLGREYGFKRPAALFGWMSDGYNGGRRLARLRGLAGRFVESDSLKGAWNRFYGHYRAIVAESERLSREDAPRFVLQNPLGMVLQAKFVGRFGARRKNRYGRVYKHHGIDLKAPHGQAVYPVAPGWVSYVGYQPKGHGNHVRIVHDRGWTSVYSHLQDDFVWKKLRERFLKEGPFWIESYELLARVGTTGNIPANDAQYGYPHLHLEISRKGKRENPQKLFREKITFLAE